MPISIATLKPGQTVFDARMVAAGNSTVRRLSVWKVNIESVDESGRFVIASWNGNPPKRYYAKNGNLPWRRSNPKEIEQPKPKFAISDSPRC